jgi:TonB family protein
MAPGSAQPAADHDSGVQTSTSIRLADDVVAPGAVRSDDRMAIGSALVVVWAAGAASSLAVLLIGFARLGWLSRQATPVDDPAWVRAAHALRHRLGLRRPPHVVQCGHPSLLVAWGWLRPTVIVPDSAGHWPADRVRMVLAHEFAHIARADALTLVAAELLRALQWFNPLAWVVARRLRHESERACDDIVLEVGTDAHAYAEQLVNVARELRARPLGLPAPAMVVPSSLERRIVAMMNTTLDRRRPSRSTRTLAVATCMALTALVASVQTGAQTGSATISGQALDQTGGTVPGVTITVENAAGDVVSTAWTDVAGRFVVSQLAPGTYRLTSQMPGFKKILRTGIEIGPAQVSEHDLTLEIGGLTETMEINSKPGNVSAVSLRSVAADGEERLAQVQRIVDSCRPPSDAPGAIRVGGSIREPRKIVDVKPAYPADLADQSIGGIVVLEGTIDEAGHVGDLRILRDPNPGLSQASVDAVNEWRFTPTLLNCEAVEVIMTVTMNFTSGQ